MGFVFFLRKKNTFLFKQQKKTVFFKKSKKTGGLG